MTLNDLNSKLTSELKSYIKQKGYIRTGDLYRSIQFTCEDNGELDISFISEDYIKYLEDGQLLQNFFNNSDVVEYLLLYEMSKIEDKINS